MRVSGCRAMMFAQDATGAIVRELVERVDRFHLHRTIGIGEHGMLDDGLRPFEDFRIESLVHGVAD
jgi:hypothetical protein